jgi:hypothetical protein
MKPVVGCNHHTRNIWTVSEADPDEDGRFTLTYNFHDPLDASDFRYSTSVEKRVRLA